MLFGARPPILPLLTSLKFGFLVKQFHFATFLISFSVWFFKMEIIPLPDLLNTGFTIIEIGLFYGSEHLRAKICRFQTVFEDGDFWSLLKRGWRVKTLQILVEFFCFIKFKHWTYFPKDVLIDCKTRYLLDFFYDFISAFDKWMLRYLFPENYSLCVNF